MVNIPVGFVGNHLHQLQGQEIVKECPWGRGSLQVIKLDPWRGCKPILLRNILLPLSQEYKGHSTANAARRLVTVEYQNQLNFHYKQSPIDHSLTVTIIITARTATIIVAFIPIGIGKKVKKKHGYSYFFIYILNNFLY